MRSPDLMHAHRDGHAERKEDNMKKAFLSTLFAMIFCLCLLPTTAKASTSAEIVSATGFDGYLNTDGTLKANYSYKLTENVTIDQPLKLAGEAELDLNGYVLKLNSSVYDGQATGSVIEVLAGGKLDLVDSNTATVHYFYVKAGSDLWRWDDTNENASTQPTDTAERTYHTVKGGVITGGSNIDGGGILVWGSHGGADNGMARLLMSGGNIIGCTANYGGGVYVGDTNANFTMSGGSIIGCAASFEGGGVHIHGDTSFTMNGGKILNCTVPRLAPQNYGRGGGVSNLGTFTMDNGSIENCRVYTKDTATCGNTTAQGGGGVYSSGTFTISGGKLVGCATTEGLGDGILLSEDKTLSDIAEQYTLKTDNGWVNHSQRYCGNVTYAPCTHEQADSNSCCTSCGKPLLAEVVIGGVTTHILNSNSPDENSTNLALAMSYPNTTLVKLLKDFNTDSSFGWCNNNLTFDLNGHTMTSSGIIFFNQNGIASMSIKSTAAGGMLNLNLLEIDPNADFNVESGTVAVTYADATNNGTVTVKGNMTVSGTGEVSYTALTLGNNNSSNPTAKMTISGGKVTGELTVSDNGALHVTGGTVSDLKVTDGSADISGGRITSLNVSGGSVLLTGGVFDSIVSSTGNGTVIDLANGGYAFYECTVNSTTNAVTRGSMVDASGGSLAGANKLFTVAEHTCSFTQGTNKFTCACGRSIDGTQAPVKYIDENGAPQYCADYTVLDSDYVSTKTEADSGNNYSTDYYLPLNESWEHWYLLSESITIGENCTVFIPYGNTVHLILADGVEVKMEGGLYDSSYSDLIIYSQSVGNRMGKLGFGGSGLSVSYNITINGGNTTVSAKKGTPLNDNSINDVYTGELIINNGSLTVERPVGADAVTSDTDAYYGVRAKNGLTINGGSLTVRVPSAAAKVVYGIYSGGATSINNSTVLVTAPNSPISISDFSMQAYGLVSQNSITINNSTVNATAASITVADGATGGNTLSAISYGVYLNNGLNVNSGSLTGKGGSVTLTGSSILSAKSSGVHLDGGNVLCRPTASLTATGGAVSATGGNPNDITVQSRGLNTHDAFFYGTVSATAGNASLTRTDGKRYPDTCNSIGIDINDMYLYDGTVTPGHGTATLTYTPEVSNPPRARTYDLYSLQLTVEGGTLKLSEANFLAVYANNGVTLADLLADGHAYHKSESNTSSTGEITETDIGFIELKDLNSLTWDSGIYYTVRACTHSATTGICDYCGKNLSAAVTPPKPSTPGNNGGSGTGSGTTTTLPDGTRIETTTDPNGSTTARIDLPAGSGERTVEIPVSNVTPGTVAIIVNEDGTETIIPLSKVTENGIQFTLDKSATVKIVDNSKQFDDVKGTDFFADAVQWASARGITDGVSSSLFAPELSSARAQLVTFLWRAAGCPVVNFTISFTDVDEAAYYGEAVRWAASLGIVGGYGNGLFGSNDVITREQVAVILYRYAKTAGMDTAQSGMTVREFSDYESVSDYALEAMSWAVNAGIIQGYDGKLMPTQPCTRSQIVTMLHRLLG